MFYDKEEKKSERKDFSRRRVLWSFFWVGRPRRIRPLSTCCQSDDQKFGSPTSNLSQW